MNFIINFRFGYGVNFVLILVEIFMNNLENKVRSNIRIFHLIELIVLWILLLLLLAT